jgi:hypothetical protein
MAKAKKTYVFEVKIGDWSGDGHGNNDVYRVHSNKPVKEVRDAYFAAKDKLPKHLCPEAFMFEYGDHSLPKNVYEDAKARGYDFFADWENPEEEPLEERLQYPQVDTEKMCDYVIWFLKQGDPGLELELEPSIDTLAFYGHDEKGRHIGFIGYGITGN